MKQYLFLLLFVTGALFAKVNVATTYNYLGEIAKRVGGEQVHVDLLANPKLDPHFITPKPSLIAKLRREDLLIINGAQLEIGWLPSLLKRANNPKINPGAKGFLDVSAIIEMLDKPQSVSRAQGDVHPDGNPHFGLDVHNVLPIAQLISLKLAQIDPSHAKEYANNFQKFKESFAPFVKQLDTKMKPCHGKKVVQYHELFNYLLKAYGIESIGTIEPLPGIAPSSKHTLLLIQKIKENGVKLILQDLYHEKKTSHFIAKKTGAKVVILPHDVGAIKGSETLEKFYAMLAQRLCQ